jgi:hypothetical protein
VVRETRRAIRGFAQDEHDLFQVRAKMTKAPGTMFPRRSCSLDIDGYLPDLLPLPAGSNPSSWAAAGVRVPVG